MLRDHDNMFHMRHIQICSAVSRAREDTSTYLGSQRIMILLTRVEGEAVIELRPWHTLEGV